MEFTEGRLSGKSFHYDDRGLTVKLEGGKFEFIGWSEVEEVELIDAKMVKKSDSFVFGAIGALIGGPLGAAAGASVGGISRPCTFFLKTSRDKFMVTGWKLEYDRFSKVFRTRKLMS